MKQRIDSVVFRSLVCSMTLIGGCPLEFATLGANPATPPMAPATNVLTLQSALRLALDNNPELRASSGRMDAATGRASQAALWPNPELTLEAEDWPVSGGGNFSDAKQTIGLAQTVPFPGKKKLEHQIGLSDVRLSEAALSLRRMELIRDVKSAFYRVLAAERLVQVADELVSVAEASSATARKRVTAGAAADHEQLRAEIPLEQARIELSMFQHELTTARHALALLLGRPALAGAPITGSLRETANLALLEQKQEQWLSAHPGLLVVKAARERAEFELRRARLEPYPDVRMGLAGGRIGETGQSIVQLGLSVPLPIIDRSKGRKQEAQANVRIAGADQDAIEQRLLGEWSTAGKRLLAAQEQAANYRERILPKANEALRLVQMGFEQGKFSFMDLLDTQRTTAEARLAYQQKLLELNLAQTELESLAGETMRLQP